jgi:hypothetical protein
MATPIYHITHVANLPEIITAGCLWSDRRIQHEGVNTVIGFDHIKRRRLEEIEVDCHPGTKVGDYVPFYFCPRSVMLYVIDRRNTQLQYQGGQREIVHLVSTVETAIEVAEGRPWAYSDGNAGAFYTKFYADLRRLTQLVDWDAVSAKNWAEPAVKNRKQAEFLVHDTFPWTAFHEIGVVDQAVADQVRAALRSAVHRPRTRVHPEWYY